MTWLSDLQQSRWREATKTTGYKRQVLVGCIRRDGSSRKRGGGGGGGGGGRGRREE